MNKTIHVLYTKIYMRMHIYTHVHPNNFIRTVKMYDLFIKLTKIYLLLLL